jgi:hypothetical protein
MTSHVAKPIPSSACGYGSANVGNHLRPPGTARVARSASAQSRRTVLAVEPVSEARTDVTSIERSVARRTEKLSLRWTDDGRFISYAQCGEDAILLRVFGDQPSGFWVDVGANHPVHDLVLKNFSDNGWTGINVEPVESLHALLSEMRPRDPTCSPESPTASASCRSIESTPTSGCRLFRRPRDRLPCRRRIGHGGVGREQDARRDLRDLPRRSHE